MITEYRAPAPVPEAFVGIPTHLSFGNGIVAGLGKLITELGLRGRAFVITDDTVGPVHGPEVMASLAGAGFLPEIYAVPAGEASKSLDRAADLYAWLASNRAERRDVVVALGGGVVGDLAGFVAATFLRGITLVQVPTTVLSMVDSSVGGKTAVNLPAGKNLVGAFHPPILTLVDVGLITGLPMREVRAGWAEVIKTAAIFDPALFDELDTVPLVEVQPDRMADILERTVRWKERVVHEDPRERGIRVVLNFGHTVGHAIEATTGYGTYLHGEAVAIGLVAASRLSVRAGFLHAGVAARIEDMLARTGLPTRYDPTFTNANAILDRTLTDKKVESNRVRWVLLRDIGQVVVTDALNADVIRDVVEALVRH